MEKQLKDYLHYYLGCECKMTKPSYHAVHELHLSTGTTFVLTGKLLHYFIEPTTKAEVKPILRKLSTTTEEEKNKIAELSKKYRGSEFTLPAFEMSKMWAAEQTHYLLSKHFDLFQLCEAGLAIDADTINK